MTEATNTEEDVPVADNDVESGDQAEAEWSQEAPITKGVYKTRYEQYGVLMYEIVHVYWNPHEDDRVGPVYEVLYYDDIEDEWLSQYGGAVSDIAHQREWQEIEPERGMQALL
jgi:hypothetical protein